jgi:pimeloyl-ACP methyl ester carboxylesterase
MSKSAVRIRMPWSWLPVFWLAAVIPCVSAEPTPRVNEASEADVSDKSGPFNFASPTLGGKQFWTDELVFNDWRIQRNTVVPHYRLLDDQNVRQAWGSFEQCLERLETLREQRKLPAHGKQIVLVLHGLGRTRSAMSGLCDYIRRNSSYTVLNVGYASTRESLSQHAESLAKIVKNLGDPEEISFVAHSMGNIVTRRYFAMRAAKGIKLPRVRRMVMLAPPNQGAQMAKRFRDTGLFELIMGASAMELAQSPDKLESQLAIPDCEFGIIAGGTKEDAGRTSLLEGDDDMVVSVEETRLAGARDFIVVPALHTVIMDNPQVREYVVRFLRQGSFVSEEKRCPIPLPASAASR